ncbi:putative P-loop containing nucleoside triphosphate hydrolase protein [Lyophyllum shimeji]|uniref:P-loop containing nucleoside triphosphate hydrolase protein n=1 Tax=Lyophyllum shimeji TaxID=47721 RepID=A0A9P3UVG2_LYOSH|nr:putative P-loop containing nucleoside triphosphate hydrolase protein [Lyophyllum shimeji]
MFSLVSFVLIFALASRAFAFNITVGKQNLTTAQILDVPDSVVKTACATNCTAATSLIQACNNDSACLCKSDTVAALLNCEQCMFTKLVEINQKMDFRVGSGSVLAGYAASCKAANITLAANQTALKLPSNWDGPFVAVLPVGGAVVAVITAGFLGISGLFLLSNIRSLSTSAHAEVNHETEAFFTSAPFYSVQPASKRLTAAEEEWLQEDQLQPSSNIPSHPVDPDQPQERFDWRLRASSRTQKPPAPSDSQTAPRQRYTRRKQPPMRSVQQGEPFYDAIQNYEDRFLKLLAAEQADAEAVLQERLSTWTLARLKEEGYCLTELSAYWLQENQFGRPVASFALAPGVVLPDHRFENGTQVLVSRIDPLLEGDKVIKGSVVSSTSSQIKVSFADMFDVDDGQWRLDVGRSNIIYDRMREAIGYLHHDPQDLGAASAADPQPILVGTHLRDVLLRTFEPSEEPHEHVKVQAPDEVAYLPHEELEHAGKPTAGASGLGAFKDDMRIQSWARRYAEVDPVVVEGDPVLEGLNATQRRAVATMIGQRISLVQGPPGTGKTKTIIEAVKLLKLHFEVPQPILVCTYTNVAVDNLVEGLIASGVKALRVGSGSNVRSSLIQHTLDHKLANHHLSPSLLGLIKGEDQLAAKVDDLRSRLGEVTKQKRSTRAQQKAENMTRALLAMEANHAQLRSRKYAMRQEMLRDVVSAADVICTTCITSACVALKVIDFPVVFLDEASMSTEPASLIPIMKGSRHVALIGDHKQLPPVITSPEAQALGLGLSLFERLTQEGVVPSMMLDTQYRMHPAISRFPSSEFYNHALQDGTVDDDGNIHSRLTPPASQHLREDVATGNRPSVIFIDHAGAESLKERSRVNLNEAHLVASIVEDLLLNNPQLMGRDIGIIAPQRFREVLGDHRAMQLANVEIKTVDGFEGREKEVIIFSTVRNNPGGYIGFLADRRRLNVGLTRARRGLFVVGNLSTLKAGKRSAREKEGVIGVGKGAESWKRYAKYVAEHGLVVKLEGDALVRALYGNLNAARGAVPAAIAA